MFATAQPPLAGKAANDQQQEQRVMPQWPHPGLSDRHLSAGQRRHEGRQVFHVDDFASGFGGDFLEPRPVWTQLTEFVGHRLRYPTGFALADLAAVRRSDRHVCPIRARRAGHMPGDIGSGLSLAWLASEG